MQHTVARRLDGCCLHPSDNTPTTFNGQRQDVLFLKLATAQLVQQSSTNHRVSVQFSAPPGHMLKGP